MADEYAISAKITGDSSGIESAFQKATEAAEGFGVNFEKVTEEGSNLLQGFGLDIEKLGGLLGVGGPVLIGIAAIGAALFEIGSQLSEIGAEYDEAFSLMGHTTGETGDALQQLDENLKNVMGSGVSQNVQDIAAGMGVLHTRLDLSGSALESFTKNLSKFAEITGGTVLHSSQDISAVLNKWNISASEGSAVMDQLAAAAENSGTSVSDLTQELTRGEAPFHELGMSFTQAAAMMGAFSKDGVNTQNLMFGLNTAIMQLTKAGVPLNEGLEQTFEAIKKAGSESEATALAIHVFGARAGVELANAVRNGKASVDEFESSLKNAGGTVDRVAEGTKTLAEAQAELGNKIQASVAPIGGVLNNLEKWFVQLGSTIWDNLSDLASGLYKVFSPIVETIGSIFSAIGNIVVEFLDFFHTVAVGDWGKAWDNLQLLALEGAKLTLDIVSGFINQVNHLMNLLIDSWNAIGSHFGMTIKRIADVSLSDMLGVNEKMREIRESETKETESHVGEIAKFHADAAENQNHTADTSAKYTSDIDKKLLAQKLSLLEEEKSAALDAAKARGDSKQQELAIAQRFDAEILKAYTAEQNEERDTALETAKQKGASKANLAKISEYYDNEITAYALKQHDTEVRDFRDKINEKQDIYQKYIANLEKQFGDWEKMTTRILDGIRTAFGGTFTQIGDDIGRSLQGQAVSWENIRKTALQALSSIVRALGDQLIAQSIIDLKNPPIAALDAAGAAAAYVAAGVIGSYEIGTQYAPGGYAMVGERGPELINLNQGARVYTSNETRNMIGGSTAIHIHSPTAINPNQHANIIRQTLQDMRFRGILR